LKRHLTPQEKALDEQAFAVTTAALADRLIG
jgi:hypothetical protein